MTVKNILLQIKHKNEIYDLYTRTNAQSVIVDKETGETLKERLATIAAMVGEGGSVDQKIQDAISELINDTGDPKVIDTIKDLVAWVNEHPDMYNDLLQVSTELENKVNTKVEELEQSIADAKEELTQSLADAKTELEGTIATTKEELQAAIDENTSAIEKNAEDIAKNVEDIAKNAEDIADLQETTEILKEEAEGVLVRRNGENHWEQIFNVVEELPATMDEGKLYCVMLEDDPVASIVKADGTIAQYATVEEALTGAEAGETIRLTENVTIPENVIVADGVTIVAEGKVIVC